MDPQTNSGTPTDQTTQTTGTESTTTAAKPDASLTDGKSSLLGKALDGAPPADPAAPPAEPKADAKPTTGAPEKYEFKLPEGFTLEGKELESATGLFRELGLSQDHAQKLVDYHAKTVAGVSEGISKLWTDTQETWVEELRSDPKIGKQIDSGEVGAAVSKMITALPVGEAAAFREALNFTGAGNHPAIVRGLFELSKRFAEPGHVQGNNPVQSRQPGSTGRPSAAEALYPKLASKES